MSFDPGSRNHAYALTEHRENAGEVQSRVIDNGLLADSALSVEDLSYDPASFIANYESLLDALLLDEEGEVQHTAVVVERFMSRGFRMSGTTGEIANMAIGILLALLHSLEMEMPYLVTASSWKKSYNARRKYDGYTLDQDYKLVRTNAHQWDSVCMGCYIGCALLDFSYLESMNTTEKVWRIMDHAENTSQTRLLNRRMKRE